MQRVEGVVFDCSNITNDANRVAQAITGGSGSVGLAIVGNQFYNISNNSQGFHALSLGGCRGCIVSDNFVSQSGGDALNFNSGEYIITGNTVQDVGDGCIAMNNNAFGIVSNNILRRCNLGVGAGPAGSVPTSNASTPFTVSNNMIEDSDFGILLGWFAYKDRLGPVNCIVSNNIIRRIRSVAIRYDGDPAKLSGTWTITGNQITHAGFPASQPPRTTGEGAGQGIVLAGISNIQVIGNSLTHGKGVALTVASSMHVIASSNLITADESESGFGVGVSVAGSTDVTVATNIIRAFASGVSVDGGSSLVQVTSNSIDLQNKVGAFAVVTAAGVTKVVVANNMVSNGPSTACVKSPDGLVHDNVCW
jgi:hypothetical protein